MVKVKVTSAERKVFRNDMKEFRKLSAAYTSLMKDEKGAKNMAERQAAAGQARLQYEHKAEELNTKYAGSPVAESVDRLDTKLRGRAVLAFVSLVGLGAYLLFKDKPIPNEQIKSITEFFQHSLLARGGGMASIALGMLSILLMMPLESVFSEKPSSTFREIRYHVERKKLESERGGS